MMVNVGVIGAGRIGKVHVNTLATRIAAARVLAVADISLEAAQSLADQYGATRATDDYHEIIHRPDIQAVLICSSTDTHSQIITEAAQAGKHIFCEKPIDFDLDRIDAALQAVVRAGVQLQIGFNRRFDPNHRRIKQAIENGEIGTPNLLHIVSRDPGPPPLSYVKVSGGIFLDMTIHDFDMARFLFGDVEEVYAAGGVMVDPAIGEAGDLDTAVITLKFTNGAIGMIENSRRAVYGYDQRVEAFGSSGSASSQNIHPNAVTISDERGVRRDLPLNFFMDRYTESFVVELEAFIKAIAEEKPVPVTGADGRAPVVIALAARKSYQENRPVRLSEID
jgi:myo-inositol 2-dehydrogenase / D-chiro-inositol 1-dehydrogenase